jgi:hypothetical protein
MKDNIMFYPAIAVLILGACMLAFLITAWFRDKKRSGEQK